MAGSKKAKVLPEPVSDIPMKSLPFNTIDQAKNIPIKKKNIVLILGMVP
jgi:hypothetical protein